MKRYGLLIIICCMFMGAAIYVNHITNKAQPVVISEVCPHNSTIIYDRFGGYSDYIEIRNQSGNAVSLKDYYLSDNKNNLRLYRIPDVVLKPGEYTLFWCREIEESFEAYVKDEDHICGFSLADGDSIYLSTPDAIVVDKVKLPKNMASDMSYTRSVDNNWEITLPSAGTAYEEVLTQKNIDAIPTFSAESGFYDDEFVLKMSCETDKAIKIYYTTDSSEPSQENGTLYLDGISIKNISDEPNRYSSISDISVIDEYVHVPVETVDKAVVIRAACIDENGNRGPVRTATYFVGYDGEQSYENMLVASLVTDPDNLFGYEDGIYVTGKVWDNVRDDAEREGYNIFRPFANYYMSGEGWKRPAYIEIFDENRNLCGSDEVKIGVQGQYSTSHTQKSLSLTAMNVEQILEGKSKGLLDGIIGHGATSLALRSGGNKDIYATKIRDTFAQKRVMGRDIGLQNAVPVQVFIDGEYWGLYHLQERIDLGYVVSHYGVDADNVIALKMEDVKAGEKADLKLYEDVIKYAEEHNLRNERYYNHISELIDIQSFIDYNCLNIYVANTDSITNNYAYWRVKDISTKPYCDGKWRWLIYDTDDSSGVVEDEMSEPYTDSFISGHWLENPLDEPLLKNLLENDSFREQFARTFIDMAENDFAWEEIAPVLNEIELRYGDAMVASMRRNFSPEYTLDDYKAAMDVLKRFYRERGDYIVDYMFNDLNLNSADFGR